MRELPDRENGAADPGRRQLTRLRWTLWAAALVGLGLWAVYSHLVLQIALHKLLLSLLWGSLLSLTLVYFCFRVVFRLYDQSTASRHDLSVHAARLQQFHTISQSLMASPALGRDVLSAALQSLVEVHDARRGSLLLLDESGERDQFLQVGLSPGAEPGPEPPSLRTPGDVEGLDATPALAASPLVGSTGNAWTAFLLPGTEPGSSFLIVPILAVQRVWGYVALADRTTGQPFSSQDQFLLQVFATTLGVVLENARLLASAQSQAEQMATLYEVGLATASSLEIDAVLVSIYDQCARVLEADIFYTALYEPEDREMTYYLFFDQGQRLPPFRTAADVGFAGWIVANRRHLCHKDEETKLERLPVAAHRPGERPARAYLGVPLVRRERVIGVLAVQSYQSDVYDDTDVQLLTMLATQATLALENALLFRETQQKLVEAALLSEVSHSISSRLTRKDLLPHLASSLARVLDCSGCFIVLRDSYTQEPQLAAVFGPDREVYEQLDLGGDDFSLPRTVFETLEPVVVQDVFDSPHLDPSVARQLPDRSLLGLPLVMQGQAVGVAVVGESYEERHFTQRHIQRAMVVANQAAVAIANARLFREVEQRLVELGTLAEISRLISSLMQPADIYQRVVDELARAFGYPYVSFYRIQGQGLELGAQVGYGEGYLPVYVPLGHTLIGDVAATGQTCYVPDMSGLSEYESIAEGVASQIVMPLRKDERVLGVLNVESFEPLTEVDLSLLQSLSYQVSTAIENDRLYAAEQREREVARTLLQIAGDLSGTLDLERVLDLILERLRAVVPYESAAIGLLSGGACYLAAADAWHRAERLWGTRIFPQDLPLVARVLDERKAVIVSDTRQFDEWVVIEDSEHIRSWLGVPLVVKDRIIGLLMLNHTTPGFYDPDAGQLALAFAQHAAVAIENAQLYDQAQAKLHEQTLLYEMTTAISSTLDAGQILRLLTERLATMLGVTSVRVVTLQAPSPAHDDRQLYPLEESVRTATVVAQHCGAEASEAEKAADLGERYALADLPLTRRALQDRRPLQLIAGEEPHEWRETMAGRSAQAMLLLPLVARNRATGFVELWESRSQRHFTDSEIALARTLTNQAAVAVENARLFAETQRRINELTLLYDVAVSAASTLDLDAILQSVVKTLQFRVLEGAVVSVLLLEDGEDGERLHLRAQAGTLEGLTSQQVLATSEKLWGEVLQKEQALLIGDTGQDARDLPCRAVARSILCVPLAWGQRIVGLLQAFHPQEKAFSHHDHRLLRTMAGSLAVAIENVRLFTQLKHSERALTLRNQALERANDRLQELDRLKSAFIASVSHELRTPLNAIIGFSEVLIDGLGGELPPQAQEYVDYIHSSGKHLLDLINDILDLSKIQAGRMTLNLERTDVMVVIREVQATLAPLASQKNQTLRTEQEEPLPSIVVDPVRLKQILLNLMGNAVKFTQERGQIAVRAWLTAPSTLRIDVQDDGPGISVEDQGLIFKEFRQARAARPPGEGTGLGLSITKRLVELHGGHVWVESELGVGSTFTVLLPVQGPEEQENVAATQ